MLRHLGQEIQRFENLEVTPGTGQQILTGQIGELMTGFKPVNSTGP